MTRLHDRIAASADFLRTRIQDPPTIAIVLGSGLGELADRLSDPTVVPYAEIPNFPRPTVAGHLGNFLVGHLGPTRVAALQGRFHFYEGHDLETVTFPVRVLQALGVKTLILTAATGGIHSDFQPGDLVCLSDHLNLIGSNPLRGTNDERLGTRFPDMTRVYSPELRGIARIEADRLGSTLREGVYACLPGPSYETPAEIRMLQTLGADVVGMSTVPEAIVARHAGMDVLAFALVTNAAAGITGEAITHEEVIETGEEAGQRLGLLIEAILARINSA
ncbi:purine-nucleoside phosphorylase [Tundrisphaera lichenicola]|uniref:purine-nucleoside phosphorylase n=1 Tax=Tundrisphaera lichenicola TaxID=2029860 RepID=UPI003EC091F4